MRRFRFARGRWFPHANRLSLRGEGPRAPAVSSPLPGMTRLGRPDKPTPPRRVSRVKWQCHRAPTRSSRRIRRQLQPAWPRPTAAWPRSAPESGRPPWMCRSATSPLSSGNSVGTARRTARRRAGRRTASGLPRTAARRISPRASTAAGVGSSRRIRRATVSRAVDPRVMRTGCWARRTARLPRDVEAAGDRPVVLGHPCGDPARPRLRAANQLRVASARGADADQHRVGWRARRLEDEVGRVADTATTVGRRASR